MDCIRSVMLWRGEVNSVRAEMKAHEFPVRRWWWRVRCRWKNRGPEGCDKVWRSRRDSGMSTERWKVIDLAIAKANNRKVRGTRERVSHLCRMKKVWRQVSKGSGVI